MVRRSRRCRGLRAISKNAGSEGFGSGREEVHRRETKAKNMIHLQRTRWVLDEIAHSILSKGNFDAGRFQALLTGLANKNSIGGSVCCAPGNTASGASSGEDEETACTIKTK